MAMAKQATAVARTELDPIDRLEEKVKLLVGVVTQLRKDFVRATEDNSRLTRELEGLRAQLTDSRARLAESEASSSELNALRAERDLIKSRVAEMLEQLEAI